VPPVPPKKAVLQSMLPSGLIGGSGEPIVVPIIEEPPFAGEWLEAIAQRKARAEICEIFSALKDAGFTWRRSYDHEL
jgi:hypothetical protein